MRSPRIPIGAEGLNACAGPDPRGIISVRAERYTAFRRVRRAPRARERQTRHDRSERERPLRPDPDREGRDPPRRGSGLLPLRVRTDGDRGRRARTLRRGRPRARRRAARARRAAVHGPEPRQDRLRRPRRRDRPDPALHPQERPRRRGLRPVRRAGRPRRHRRRQGTAVPDQGRGALALGRRPRPALQGADRPAREVPRAQGHREALPAAVPRPRHERAGPRDLQDPEPDRLGHSILPLRPGLSRVRDAHAPADLRRGERAPVHDASQLPRPDPLPPDRARALPQAARGRRVRAGLRGLQELPERGHRLEPQPRVHHGRGVRGLPRLPRDDGPDRGPDLDPGPRGHTARPPSSTARPPSSSPPPGGG